MPLPPLWVFLLVLIPFGVCLAVWLLVTVTRCSAKALPESKPLKPPGTYAVDPYPADAQTRAQPLDDIPDTYTIVEFPSTGRAFYMPKFKGRFIFSCFRSCPFDTSDHSAHGIECKTKEQAIQVIRDHMLWKAPRPLPRDKWKD